MIATSDDWGVSKPDPGFFRQMLEARYRGPDGKLRPAPSTFQRKTDAARYLRPRGAWPATEPPDKGERGEQGA